MIRIKTATRAVNPCSRVLQKAVIYFLDLNKISLISSLKSVTSTAITAMNRFESIMDSLQVEFRPHTQLNSQKKSSAPQKRTELNQLVRLCKTFLSIYRMDQENYSTKMIRE